MFNTPVYPRRLSLGSFSRQNSGYWRTSGGARVEAAAPKRAYGLRKRSPGAVKDARCEGREEVTKAGPNNERVPDVNVQGTAGVAGRRVGGARGKPATLGAQLRTGRKARDVD